MMDQIMVMVVPAAVGIAVAWSFFVVADRDSLFAKVLNPYFVWWRDTLTFCRADERYNMVPKLQLIVTGVIGAISLTTREPIVLGFIAPTVALPPLILYRKKSGRLLTLESDLDGFLTALADSLTTIPNLAGALASLVPNIDEPIKSEVLAALAEVKLGRSVDDALRNMSGRLSLPGLDAAVGAALLGKRTGGELPVILRRIASTQREMARLEGVVKTKTAEGRSQAWVMGSVPPGLILILEWVNPEWLAPLWADPIGWIMLGGAAVFEVIAIVLIRKIMAVEI